jgi:hypothetical protein
MTYHISDGWKLEDGPENAPVVQIAEAIKHHGYKPPPVFGVFSAGDSFILNISVILQEMQGQLITEESVKEFCGQGKDLPEEHKETIFAVIFAVLEKLELLGEVFTDDKKKPG